MIAVVCCVLNLLSFWVSANLGNGEQRQLEKLLAFECGLEPLGDSRSMKFEILFFLVALLYLIFDLEIVLLFPLAITCTSLFSLYSPLAFSALLLFLILLTAAFLYEWLLGALDVADTPLYPPPALHPMAPGRRPTIASLSTAAFCCWLSKDDLPPIGSLQPVCVQIRILT